MPEKKKTDNEKLSPVIICYHEAGHAVMAHLRGRYVQSIILTNVEKTYNGETKWGRYQQSSDWGLVENVPYDELELKPEDNVYDVALVHAAGKAAERIWYRQRNLDENLASANLSNSEIGDEHLLEKELLRIDPQLRPEKLPEEKQLIENFAIRQLEVETCWQAVEKVANTLLEKISEKLQMTLELEEVQAIIFTVFQPAKLRRRDSLMSCHLRPHDRTMAQEKALGTGSELGSESHETPQITTDTTASKTAIEAH